MTPDLLPERLSRRIAVDPETACWNWVGLKTGQGYPRTHMMGPKGRFVRRLAHRVVYELLAGPIPEGLQIDHLCRNPSCVNPAHLEPVTARTNTERGLAPWAVARRRGTCIRGHPLNAEVCRVDKNGAWVCRACDAIRHRKARP